MPRLTIDQAMQMAVQHHLAGRLQQAEQLYRQILAAMPDHVPAIHHLGLLAHHVGRNDVAAGLIRRAITLQPNDADFHSNLGNVLRACGLLDEAIAAYRTAISLRPDFAEAYNNVGIALHERGLTDEAISACRQALALNPNLPESHYNLGIALEQKGRRDEAIAGFRRAIALRPNYADAYNNLGNALGEKGQFEEAYAAYRQAAMLNPNSPQAHYNCGNALNGKRDFPGAIAAYRQAITLKPNYAEAHGNLGLVLKTIGQIDPAMIAYRRAIALNPDLSEAHYNLGIALGEEGQVDDAVAAYRRAVAIRPDYGEAFNNLGLALKDQGRPEQACEAHEQAVTFAPHDPRILSNRLLSLHYHPEYSAAMLEQEHRRWDERHGKPFAKSFVPHANTRDPDRRLKIGYLSPDFRDHVVGRNILPLFREHDPVNFEIHCYVNHVEHAEDLLTDRFRAHAHKWKNIQALSDQAAADTIRADGIDILIDLALHSANNRLPVFARKPAPVQITFAGYPGGTGLTAMDYRLTDFYLDPIPSDQDRQPSVAGNEPYVETSIRLRDSFWCYDPAAMMLGLDREPQVGALPALTNGYVTFGCLNNFAKVNARVLNLWATVLKAIPTSRMLLGASEGSHRQATLDHLRQAGIDPNRIEFVSPCKRDQYLDRYHRIDLGLDTLPYNGHTTSLDAMWMGVPVVTLAGETAVGRAGVSQLANLGRTELIAHTPEEYTDIAASLAADLPRLSEIRSTLRDRMQHSPLTDAARFTRNIEEACRDLWRRWCDRKE